MKRNETDPEDWHPLVGWTWPPQFTHLLACLHYASSDWHLRPWGRGKECHGSRGKRVSSGIQVSLLGPNPLLRVMEKKKKTRKNLSKHPRNRKGSLKKKHTQSYFWEKIIRKSHTCQRQRGRKIWLKTPVAEIAGAPKEWDSPGVAGDKSWLVWLAAWGDI